MGYTTTFDGELKFNRDLTEPEIKKINEIFEFDPRAGNHSQNSPYEFDYIDLELNESKTAIRWNGMEKSYGMIEQIEYLIKEVTKFSPDLVLNGTMSAEGEDEEDRWELIVEDNIIRET
jgi:hypothetical protein